MATYKLEIKHEFGQYHHRLQVATDAAPAFSGPVKDLRALIEAVDRDLDARKIGATDTVVFRQLAFEDRRELRDAVRNAKY